MGRANNVHILFEIYAHILSYDYILPREQKYVSLGLPTSWLITAFPQMLFIDWSMLQMY